MVAGCSFSIDLFLRRTLVRSVLWATVFLKFKEIATLFY